jgi:hypothetical protein
VLLDFIFIDIKLEAGFKFFKFLILWVFNKGCGFFCFPLKGAFKNLERTLVERSKYYFLGSLGMEAAKKLPVLTSV